MKRESHSVRVYNEEQADDLNFFQLKRRVFLELKKNITICANARRLQLAVLVRSKKFQTQMSFKALKQEVITNKKIKAMRVKWDLEVARKAFLVMQRNQRALRMAKNISIRDDKRLK